MLPSLLQELGLDRSLKARVSRGAMRGRVSAMNVLGPDAVVVALLRPLCVAGLVCFEALVFDAFCVVSYSLLVRNISAHYAHTQ